jgi:hypothetical protein
VQTSDNEIIEVKFQEIDGMEKVLLVERAAGSEAVKPCHACRLLGIEELDRAEIEAILARAKDFQPAAGSQSLKKLDTLRGKMIVNLFFEASTRTRTSFEIAAKRLGADAISITASGSSVSKGESLVDTLNTLAAMRPDAIVMRHAASGAPHFLARHLPMPIINAGDGTHEHPTQALLDARTILDRAPRSKACAWPSSATSRTAAWPAPTSICFRNSARDRALRTGVAAAARNWQLAPGVRSPPISAKPSATPTSS